MSFEQYLLTPYFQNTSLRLLLMMTLLTSISKRMAITILKWCLFCLNYHIKEQMQSLRIKHNLFTSHWFV